MAKRSISFVEDDAMCVYHDGAVMDVESIKADEIWHHAHDMQIMKRKVQQLTRKEANQDSSLGAILTNTYGGRDQATVDTITAWCVGCSGRRGLERFLNRDYCSRRSDQRRRVIVSVLRAQAKMREEGVQNPEYISTVLSRLSETFSKDSIYLARAMGVGDERAVGLEEQESSSSVVVEFCPRKKVARNNSPFSVMDVFATVPQQPPWLEATAQKRSLYTRLNSAATPGDMGCRGSA